MIPVGGRNFVHGRSTTRVRGGLATSWPQFIDPAGIAAIVRGARAQLGDAKNTFLTYLHIDDVLILGDGIIGPSFSATSPYCEEL
jgi:hypothetical protein